MPARQKVTPYVGVWIEISNFVTISLYTIVTPYVGVWIEIDSIVGAIGSQTTSPPMWGCGLKYHL